MRASKEVVLCGGAVNSPQLLLLSGIGPRAELSPLGIETAVDAPGVGKKLRDVAAVGICTRTGHSSLDKEIVTPWPILRYLLFRSGPLASNTLEASAWISERRLAKHALPCAPDAAEATPAGGAPDEGAWAQLKDLLDASSASEYPPAGSPDEADGAAAGYTRVHRHEAAAKLIANHTAVLRDVTNPSPAPTQAHLRRVPLADANHADAALRETARRLIGRCDGTDALIGRPDASQPTQADAWSAVAAYFAARIQTSGEQRPGRRADMSADAAAAMRAVLAEVGSLGGAIGTALPVGGDAPPVTREAPPAMQLLVQPLLFPFASWGKFHHFVSGLKAGSLPSALSVHVVLLRPESTGSVRLRSASPHAPPVIDPCYLTARADLDKLVAGVQLTRELLSTSPEMRHKGEVLPGEAITTRRQLDEYVRANACHFNGSLCGTCHMGPASDPLAVVDELLRVRGVSGLRVVDASVMPTLISGQLNACVTAIAERAATLIVSAYAPPAADGDPDDGVAGPGAPEALLRQRRPPAEGYQPL